MPDEPTGGAVAGTTMQWSLWNPRRKEGRTYVQEGLTIEGEARLIGLSRKLGTVLGEAGYSFGELGEFFDDERPTDWPRLLTLVEVVAEGAPDLVADATTVLLGIYPTEEDGSRNEKFEDERLYLRGAINIALFVEMTQVLVTQNQYSRLVAPFGRTLAEAMDAFAAPRASASSDGSAPAAIVGTDGSVTQLEPETTTDGSTPTTEPTPSETATPSAPSRRSRRPASETRGTSGGT